MTTAIFGPYDEPPSGGCGDVVLDLPPLADALPVAWERYLRNRLRHPYETWLEAVLSDPPADWPTVRSFWERHHYDVLVKRWQAVVGDRLVLRISVPHDDASAALTPGLTPGLTPAQAEVIRRINVAFHHREWPAQRYDQVVRRGVVAALLHRSDSAADGRIVTAGWAIKRANAIAAGDVARIATTGVRVNGDLAALGRVRVPRSTTADEVGSLTLDAAVDAVVGAVEAVAATWPR
jgi:hypothetical protein